MSVAVILSLALISVVPDAPAGEAPNGEKRSLGVRAEPRPLHEIISSVHVALRSEATAETLQDHTVAVESLVSLYDEVVGDPRRREGTQLERLRMKLRVRLVRVKERIEKQLEQEKVTKSDPVRSMQGTDSSYGATDGGRRPDDVGPADPGRRGGGAAAAAAANGAALVELIERTISPDIWDVNGGPATIFYFAPRHALVVSAPGEIHHNLGRLLGDLRRAGGP